MVAWLCGRAKDAELFESFPFLKPAEAESEAA